MRWRSARRAESQRAALTRHEQRQQAKRVCLAGPAQRVRCQPVEALAISDSRKLRGKRKQHAPHGAATNGDGRGTADDGAGAGAGARAFICRCQSKLSRVAARARPAPGRGHWRRRAASGCPRFRRNGGGDGGCGCHRAATINAEDQGRIIFRIRQCRGASDLLRTIALRRRRHGQSRALDCRKVLHRAPQVRVNLRDGARVRSRNTLSRQNRGKRAAADAAAAVVAAAVTAAAAAAATRTCNKGAQVAWQVFRRKCGHVCEQQAVVARQVRR